MGDSITAGWGEAHPSLFSGDFVNRGIGGQTTQQMLLRFRQDVIELHPAAVHILAGTNDILSLGGPVTPLEIEGDIESMVEMADVRGIAVVLGSVPPLSPPWGSPPRRAALLVFNAWLRAYAHENHVPMADYYAVLVSRSGDLAPALAIDAVHPNRDGYAKMESLMGVALGQAMQAKPAGTVADRYR
jgi:lysophospholipase L1-like esterase